MTIRGKIRDIIKELKELDNFISSYSSQKPHIEGYELGTYIDDIDIEIAKNNYQKHKEKIKIKQDDYKKKLICLINQNSKDGYLNTDTINIHDEDFMSYDFLIELAEYFTNKGFKCEMLCINKTRADGYLRISGWQ